MSEEELLKDLRVRMTPTHVVVEVRCSREPGEPARWSLAALLRRTASAWEIERARRLTLADYRYFRICDQCRERYPRVRVRSLQGGEDLCDLCLPETPPL